jgi:hypothetical protein
MDSAVKPPLNRRQTAVKPPANHCNGDDKMPVNEQERRVYKYVLDNAGITTTQAMELDLCKELKLS